MKKQMASLLVAGALVSACAHPHVVPDVNQMDYTKDCKALREDMEQTAYYQKAAKADNKAEARYLLIFNAFVSWYNMEQAENAATARLAELQRIYKDKKCTLKSGTLNIPAEPKSAPIRLEKPPVYPKGASKISTQSND